MNKSTIKKKRKTQSIKPDINRLTRILNESESFYFYKSEGHPIDEKANSLLDFLKKIEEIDPLSLEFHYYRGDFGRWINNSIGDSVLGYRLNGKEGTNDNGEGLRNNIKNHLKNRFEELNIQK